MHKALTHVPATKLVSITASDTTVYSPPLRAIYVAVTGNVAIVASDDTAAVTVTAVPAGTILPISTSQVMSTNTTATGIIGLR